MKRYIGTKIIHAERQDRPDESPSQVEGYKVVYADGYTSWSPKDTFEEAYREASSLTFGLALEALKKGYKVARSGWNGKGMWLVLVPGTKTVNFVEGSPYMKAGLTSGEILPHIDMYTTNSDGNRAMLCGWLASQTDILSNDWTIVQ